MLELCHSIAAHPVTGGVDSLLLDCFGELQVYCVGDDGTNCISFDCIVACDNQRRRGVSFAS